MLRIRITRRCGKPPLLICTRADGSRTMAEIAVGPEHDLAHYAVETTLGFRRAFYGLLADGMAIEEFHVPAAAARLNLPDEAVWTEFIVGLIQVERLNGAPYDDFNSELHRALANARKPIASPAPTLSNEQLAAIRATWSDLCERWSRVRENGSMDLQFSVPNSTMEQ